MASDSQSTLEESPRPTFPSLDDLTDKLQSQFDMYKATRSDSPSPTWVDAPEIAVFSSRAFKEPIAAVAICPAYPEYMVVGTYTLLKPYERGAEPGQVRTGCISVLPLADTFKPSYPGAAPPHLDKVCLNAAVLDIHFHPVEKTLFGVATSNAKIAFFRVSKTANVLARRVEIRLLPLGMIKIGEENEYGEIPLVTAFHWILLPRPADQAVIDRQQRVEFTATLSNGEVKIIEANVPGDIPPDKSQSSPKPPAMLVSTVDLAKHAQEAWTSASASILNSTTSVGDIETFLILSGGDDSALIASSAKYNPELGHIKNPPFSAVDFNRMREIEDRDANLIQTQRSLSAPNSPIPDPNEIILPTQANPHKFTSGPFLSPPVHRWTDRKSHTAGVVAILPLPPYAISSNATTTPILTGSYDESIRLFLVTPNCDSPVVKREEMLSRPLGGGVWRLKLMFESTTIKRVKTADDEKEEDYEAYTALVLASCMLGGVRILRVTRTGPCAPVSVNHPQAVQSDAPAPSLNRDPEDLKGKAKEGAKGSDDNGVENEGPIFSSLSHSPPAPVPDPAAGSGSEQQHEAPTQFSSAALAPASSDSATDALVPPKWSIKVVQKFTKGHESMVYDCDFFVRRKEDGMTGSRGKEKKMTTTTITTEYTIVSTSFYDGKVCVWTFRDEGE